MPPTASRTVLRTVTLLALAASVVRFAWSGVYVPFDHPNLSKFDEEAAPLREHLDTGAPVHSSNPAQYGPVFFFVLHPLAAARPAAESLARWLYAIQIACIAIAFWTTCAVLKWTLAPDEERWPLIVAWLAIVWLNFSPLYTVVALKSVETWELVLITIALAAYLHGRHGTAAIAIAGAGLIKVLPFAFLYYWLVTNRRTFVYGCVAVAALLLAGHLLYGAEMGLAYPLRVAATVAGNSYGLDWHENISLKAAVAKLFGYLPLPTHDAARTSGYFLALTGGRRTAAVAIGDALVVAGVVLLTWTWTRTKGQRSRERTMWEWSVLTIAVLILSPNTVFEYLAIALGAVSYTLARLALERTWSISASCFVVSLLLLGGLIPRQWLNRVLMIDALNRLTGLRHLTASEAYQYYCFPLAGLLLLLITICRMEPTD